MLGAADDFLLQFGSQIVEIVAVACHTYNQVLVFLRIFLGIAQGIGRNHIELNVVSVLAEIGPDQLGDLPDAPARP